MENIVTDVIRNNPNNISIVDEKEEHYVCKIMNIYNSDSVIPMQKFSFVLNNVKILSHMNSLLNISISLNEPMNNKIYKFIMELEKNIGMQNNLKHYKTNFSCSKQIVTICLYSKNMVIYDRDNNRIKNNELDFGKFVSVMIELSKVICNNSTYTPIWNVTQIKLHETHCMFDIYPRTEKERKPIAKVVKNSKEIKDTDKIKEITKDSEKNITPPPMKFAPSVMDIVKMRSQLRNVKN